MIYQWKTIKYKVDAQIAGEELERIACEQSLTPEAVVAESKSKVSPLHEIFEWNNEKAGHEWRKQQARVMIDNLVTVQIEENEVEPIRAFVNVAGGEYTSIDLVVKSQPLYDAYVEQALKELNSFKKKYREVIGIKKHFEKLDSFINGIRQEVAN